MFGYRAPGPRVSLTTDRMVVRLINDRDDWKMSDYYAENRQFLLPWEPIRDESYFQPAGWHNRLSVMTEHQRQGSAYYFVFTDPDDQHVLGVANFSNVVRGCFYACYLGYSLGEKWQGQGLMQEGLSAAIRYIQRQQKIHRIMANYMPRNQRSANVLSRLGFEKEGYAKDYLLINGVWEDHVLTALTWREGSADKYC